MINTKQVLYKSIGEWIEFYKEQLYLEEKRLLEIKSNTKTTGTNDYINAIQWIRNYKEKIAELEKKNGN